jgi:pyruvate dehydrogenase E1 component beta subunit
MVKVALDAAESLAFSNIYPDVIDLRVLSPLDLSAVFASVSKTGRLLVVDGGWESCGLGAEVIARVAENPSFIKKIVHVSRLSLPCHPAPNNLKLEEHYYTSPKQLASRILSICNSAL